MQRGDHMRRAHVRVERQPYLVGNPVDRVRERRGPQPPHGALLPGSGEVGSAVQRPVDRPVRVVIRVEDERDGLDDPVVVPVQQPGLPGQFLEPGIAEQLPQVTLPVFGDDLG